MTCPSWVSLHGIAHSFSVLLKPLRHDKAAIREGAYWHSCYVCLADNSLSVYLKTQLLLYYSIVWVMILFDALLLAGFPWIEHKFLVHTFKALVLIFLWFFCYNTSLPLILLPWILHASSSVAGFYCPVSLERFGCCGFFGLLGRVLKVVLP